MRDPSKFAQCISHYPTHLFEHRDIRGKPSVMHCVERNMTFVQVQASVPKKLRPHTQQTKKTLIFDKTTLAEFSGNLCDIRYTYAVIQQSYAHFEHDGV